MNSNIHIRMDVSATDDEKEAAKLILKEAGLNARFDEESLLSGSTRHLSDYSHQASLGITYLDTYYRWVILIAIPLTYFFKSFIGEAGKDAYLCLKKFVARLWESRKDPEEIGGIIMIQDENAHVDIWISQKQMSDEAVRSLLEMDLSSLKPVSVLWDEGKQKWTNLEKRT